MSRLSLDRITKTYGETTAVRDVTLEISSGEFFSFLGPSGCGKTTLLRIIAGLEIPTNGRILIDGFDVTSAPPQRRDTVMVFQNYALFPHMTVSENVAFGLEARGIARFEIRERSIEALSLVQLEQRINSPIQDLSGGEQQRVALARAIVVRPKILLMDEPLSNLDITLRAETRSEIKRLQRATGITTVYVTHDQTEALGLSDRIAVLHRGRVVQVGSPTELYEHPQHVFVASFLGNANVLRAQTSRLQSGEMEAIVNDQLRFTIDSFNRFAPGDSLLIAVRPEGIRLTAQNAPHKFKATVESVEFQGTSVEYRIQSGGQELRVVASRSDSPEVSVRDIVGVTIDQRHCFVYSGEEV